jgi:hypothetical protein
MKTLYEWIAAAAAASLLAVGVAHAQQPRVQRTADGRPDLSGIWRAANNRPLSDLVAGNSQIVLQPWAAALYRDRRASGGTGRPSERCLPRGVPSIMLARDQPWKIVQTPGIVIILFRESLHFRQIFTDGRPFPADPAPSWLGYTVGRWADDALVAETIGLTEQTWLDEGGHPHSEALRVTERFRRMADTMDLDITIDDPKTYSRPWTVTVPFERVRDADLGEDVCAIQPAP